MPSIIKIVLIFVGVFFLFFILGNYFLRYQFENLEKILPPDVLQKIKSISPEQILKSQGGEKEIKEFVSPDGKLKINYTSDWGEIKSGDLEKIIPKEQVDKYELKALFSAQKAATGNFAQIIISEGTFDVQKKIEEITEEMRESNQLDGWNMTIFNLEANEHEGVFEAKYTKPDRYTVHTKEKIIFLSPENEKKKAYLIGFIAFDKDWSGLEKEATEILDSVQLTP